MGQELADVLVQFLFASKDAARMYREFGEGGRGGVLESLLQRPLSASWVLGSAWLWSCG